jgi:hypothetical protein
MRWNLEDLPVAEATTSPVQIAMPRVLVHARRKRNPHQSARGIVTAKGHSDEESALAIGVCRLAVTSVPRV